jgi:hypothetical protein
MRDESDVAWFENIQATLARALVSEGYDNSQARDLAFSVAQGIRDVPPLIRLLEGNDASADEILEAVHDVVSNRYSLIDAAKMLSLDTKQTD